MIIGILDKNAEGKLFLLTSEKLDKVNYTTISKIFNQSMFLLWLEYIRDDDVILLVFVTYVYMAKAANSLNVLNSKTMHRLKTVRGKFN